MVIATEGQHTIVVGRAWPPAWSDIPILAAERSQAQCVAVVKSGRSRIGRTETGYSAPLKEIMVLIRSAQDTEGWAHDEFDLMCNACPARCNTGRVAAWTRRCEVVAVCISSPSAR